MVHCRTGVRGAAGLRAAGQGKRKFAIPMHYGANPLGKGTPQELIQALGSTSTKILPLKPGEQAEF